MCCSSMLLAIAVGVSVLLRVRRCRHVAAHDLFGDSRVGGSAYFVPSTECVAREIVLFSVVAHTLLQQHET